MSGTSSSPTNRKPSTYSLLPTPIASDGHGGQAPEIRRAGGPQVDLSDLAPSLFPLASCPMKAERKVHTTLPGASTAKRSAAGKQSRDDAPHNPASSAHAAKPGSRPALANGLMGLPEGFVTDLGLPYGAQHRVLGNGVVPQQAAAALRLFVGMAVQVEQEQAGGE